MTGGLFLRVHHPMSPVVPLAVPFRRLPRISISDACSVLHRDKPVGVVHHYILPMRESKCLYYRGLSDNNNNTYNGPP